MTEAIGRATEPADEPGVVTYLSRLFSAVRIEQAWALHLRKMASYGFDRVVYSNARLADGVGVLEDTLILSNHDRSFLDPFLSSGMWRGGIFIRHAERVGRLSVPWRVTPELDLSDEDRRILEFRASHGVVAGCSISFRQQIVQGRAGMGLCARRDIDQDGVDDIWAQHGRRIEVLCVAFHLRVSSLPLDLPGRALSPRQREALRWVGDGKTLQDIAQIMAVSVPTVEKHLRLARAALGVQTTTQAVLKASFLNQLFRIESAG
jgi:LuxR family transcriptional regulator